MNEVEWRKINLALSEDQIDGDKVYLWHPDRKVYIGQSSEIWDGFTHWAPIPPPTNQPLPKVDGYEWEESQVRAPPYSKLWTRRRRYALVLHGMRLDDK